MALALMLQAVIAPTPVCAQAVTQADMNACADATYRRADAALNAQWRRTATDLAGRRAKLIAAQRAWLVFRDAECDAATADSRGGSIHGMAVTECRTRLTVDRTHQLAAIAAATTRAR